MAALVQHKSANLVFVVYLIVYLLIQRSLYYLVCLARAYNTHKHMNAHINYRSNPCYTFALKQPERELAECSRNLFCTLEKEMV